MHSNVGASLSGRDFVEALGDGDRRFRDIVDVLPVAIYATDAAGRLMYVNQAAIRLSGRVPELGSDQWCVSSKLYHPDGRPMPHDNCPMATAIKEGRALRGMEIILERPDGRRLWCEANPTPLCDADGHVIGGVNMLVDITERKVVEEAAAYRAAIVEWSDDAIISKDLNGVITSWNLGAERLFGYTAQEAIGQSITIIFPPDRLDEEPRILGSIRRGEVINHYETVRRRKDGTLVDVSLTVSPVRDKRGAVVGVSKIARDITERKRVERTLRNRNKSQRRQLRQALQSSREVTEVLQRGLLPERLPSSERVGIAVRYIPASSEATVGGDFYDGFVLPNGHLGLAIGDVAGHGVQAASLMGQMRLSLRAYGHEGHRPAAVLGRLDSVLTAGKMVTVLYLVVDPMSGQATYANAGHMPPLILTPGGASRFLFGGDPPMTGRGHQYKTFRTSIRFGETMILYTDGLVESDHDIDAGLARLAEVSTSAASADLEDVATTIVNSIAEGTGRRDDIALLAFRLQRPDPDRSSDRP